MQLWDWACAAYGRQGVPELCLRLQDEDGQNVPLLLWAAWAGPVEPELVVRVADVARAWETAVVAPLRAARRGLKAPRAAIPDAHREELRDEVKAAELTAERLLLEALAEIAPRGSGEDREQALAAASAAWGIAAPADRLAALAAAVE